MLPNKAVHLPYNETSPQNYTFNCFMWDLLDVTANVRLHFAFKLCTKYLHVSINIETNSPLILHHTMWHNNMKYIHQVHTIKKKYTSVAKLQCLPMRIVWKDRSMLSKQHLKQNLGKLQIILYVEKLLPTAQYICTIMKLKYQ